MTGERRLEYEKGPSLEEEADEEPSDDGDEGLIAGRVRRPLSVAPWKAGLVAGVGAFVVVYAVIYQIVGPSFGAGVFAGMENEPRRWIVAGQSMLTSHGAVLEEGGEPVPVFSGTASMVSHVTALIPVVVLALTGHLLVRSVRLESRADAGIAFASLAGVYVVFSTALGTIATWNPEGNFGGPTLVTLESEAESGDVVAVVVDAGMVLTTTNTVLVAVAIGAGVALLSRRLEHPVSTSSDGGDSADD